MVRPRFRIRQPHPLLLATALLVAAALQGRAQSQAAAIPPAAALNWLDPGLLAAWAEVERLEAGTSPWGQFEYQVSVDPHLRFRDYPGDGAAGAWDGRLGLSATFEFSDPPDNLARALQSLERARRAVELLELDGVADALLAHADLLIAQRRVQEASAELAESEAALEDDAASEADRLELQMADLELRIRLQALADARAEALAFGMSGTAIYEPLRFELPEPTVDPRGTHDFRILRLELREAVAELELAIRAPLDDLRLRTSYRLPGAGFDIEGGLVNGSPAALVGIDLPGGVHRLEVEVSAQLVLSDNRREIARLKAAAARARSELAEYRGRFRAEFEAVFAQAILAEEALDLHEREFELHGEPATGRLYRAWIDYVRAVARVLELSGGSWVVRSE